MQDIENIYNRLKKLNTGEYLSESFDTNDFLVSVDRRKTPIDKNLILNISFYEPEKSLYFLHKYLLIKFSGDEHFEYTFIRKIGEIGSQIYQPEQIKNADDLESMIKLIDTGVCRPVCNSSKEFLEDLKQLLEQVENYVDFCRYECDI